MMDLGSKQGVVQQGEAQGRNLGVGAAEVGEEKRGVRFAGCAAGF